MSESLKLIVVYAKCFTAVSVCVLLCRIHCCDMYVEQIAVDWDFDAVGACEVIMIGAVCMLLVGW